MKRLLSITLGQWSLAVAACTSALVLPSASENGNALLWKHRDTSHAMNYVDTVKGQDREHDYVALFNAADTSKREAWAGANRSGFAIINTVAGNLPRNNANCKDREGLIMTLALQKCTTVADFANLLDTLPRPLGVQTNFGVADREGNMAYFETTDKAYVRYDVSDSVEGYLVRSNFAESGSQDGGYGYERHALANDYIGFMKACNCIDPVLFTEYLSREYMRGVSGKDFVKDGRFIPRPTSSASVVIELADDGPVMWAALGYPPCAIALPATVDSVPDQLKLDLTLGGSRAAIDAYRLRPRILRRGYVNLNKARSIADSLRIISIGNYKRFREKKSADNDENTTEKH